MSILESNTTSSQVDVINNGTSSEAVAQDKAQHTLRESVEVAMENYFSQLDGQKVVDLYELVISEVEAPLMEAVMEYTRGNQTKASVAMGLNRGTLRKKLKKYNML